MPSPLSLYAPLAAQSDDPDLSEQTAATIAQLVELLKKEEEEAVDNFILYEIETNSG